MEEFRKVYGCRSKRYLTVSNLGNVKNEEHLRKDKYTGYVYYYNDHLAVLVAKAFPEICGKWFKGCQVDHINTIRTDNRAENLRFCTQKENMNNPITKMNLSKAKTGKHIVFTEEHKKKISNALKGKKKEYFEGKQHPMAKKIVAYNKDMTVYKGYDCVKYASEDLGIGVTSINNNLKGRSKSAGGLIFKYA